ncbi:unnamed protein product [Fusarium venenatum]|uniref:Uncharacterized protein n=1 Tax=Fusarium venenatum TaxID=56646 RepID=A0A2L2T9P2_9HYPO|nr:uncharacterized protein FVRRES_05443 [Fusarium venenatum]CEI61007.1 unnamed protein product [Fusarium venenatum]
MVLNRYTVTSEEAIQFYRQPQISLRPKEATSEELNLRADEIFSDSDTSPGVVTMTDAVPLGALFK